MLTIVNLYRDGGAFGGGDGGGFGGGGYGGDGGFVASQGMSPSTQMQEGRHRHTPTSSCLTFIVDIVEVRRCVCACLRA